MSLWVFTKDIGDAKGYFWTSTQLKKAMESAFKHLAKQPSNTSVAYDAIYLDTVRGYGNIGWDLKARRIRANVLAEFLDGKIP